MLLAGTGPALISEEESPVQIRNASRYACLSLRPLASVGEKRWSQKYVTLIPYPPLLHEFREKLRDLHTTAITNT